MMNSVVLFLLLSLLTIVFPRGTERFYDVKQIKSSNLDGEEFQLLRDTFNSFDANRDGYWGKDDLGDFMWQQGIEESADDILKAVDLNEDSLINLNEFRHWDEMVG